MVTVAWEFYSGIGEVLVRKSWTILNNRCVGGLHLALQRSTVDGKVVHAFDWDQTACKVYSANHGPNIVQKVYFQSYTRI